MLRHTVFKITRNVTSVRTVNTVAQDLSPEALAQQEFSYSKVQLLGRVGQDPKLVGLYQETALFHVFVNYHPSQLSETEPDLFGDVLRSRANWFTVFATKPSLKTYVMESVRKRTRVLCIGSLSRDAERNVFTVKLNDLILIDTPRLELNKRGTAGKRKSTS
ncbi:PREDICTED: uncharacterized protein LOC100632749 [Amphimedon queenslandica]|uniref:Uncharacterized protein n=1 Tax=Amphimedon queenslandica TaxID=400682 RepID=A0A1X7UVW1_AMPQE|nr:PREDICTED: uncharacterized protein LOC100632749 [Amphimedon queenslandica]|eukprot:XP_003386552.1 PREDICTED: uncharacterized protein LOC100632749 [Amphimedon queenslandica]